MKALSLVIFVILTTYAPIELSRFIMEGYIKNYYTIWWPTIPELLFIWVPYMIALMLFWVVNKYK